MVARFGGDEFVISLNQITRVEDIKTIADNIMKTFTRPFNIKGQNSLLVPVPGLLYIRSMAKKQSY